VPRTVQLRRYTIKPHLVEEFLTWWQARLVPARTAFAFTVDSAYLNRDTREFTWAVSAEGDAEEFRRLETIWMDSPERAALFDVVDGGWHDATDIALVERLV